MNRCHDNREQSRVGRRCEAAGIVVNIESDKPAAWRDPLSVYLLGLTSIQADKLALEVLPALLIVSCWSSII